MLTKRPDSADSLRILVVAPLGREKQPDEPTPRAAFEPAVARSSGRRSRSSRSLSEADGPVFADTQSFVGSVGLWPAEAPRSGTSSDTRTSGAASPLSNEAQPALANAREGEAAADGGPAPEVLEAFRATELSADEYVGRGILWFDVASNACVPIDAFPEPSFGPGVSFDVRTRFCRAIVDACNELAAAYDGDDYVHIAQVGTVMAAAAATVGQIRYAAVLGQLTELVSVLVAVDRDPRAAVELRQRNWNGYARTFLCYTPDSGSGGSGGSAGSQSGSASMLSGAMTSISDVEALEQISRREMWVVFLREALLTDLDYVIRCVRFYTGVCAATHIAVSAR